MLTSLVGLPLSELDTPALLIDLDTFERNIASLAGDILARNCGWRPHTKAHKTPAISHMQIKAGAHGMTCAKLGEAEVMAAGGVKDILVANQIVGRIKTRRLAELSKHVDVKVAVDSVFNVREHAAAAKTYGSKIGVVIEVNTGMNRSGVEPGQATLDLAKEIVSHEGLRFAGIMTWEGHSMSIEDPEKRKAEIVRCCETAVETAELLRANGIPVGIVSAGGTGTYLTSAAVEGITEVQAGGGIFGDKFYRDLGAKVEGALTVMTQVISRPAPDRIILDAGRKTVDPSLRAPVVKNLNVPHTIGLSAEHGIVRLERPVEAPVIGDRVELWVGYGDQCNHLHENFYGIRNGMVETIWPIAGRGRIQ